MSLTKVTYSMINGSNANVLDFGAVGDGVTDDTAAIQAALDSNATIIEFPPVSAFYKVTAPIKIPHRKALRGYLRSQMIGSYVQPDKPRIQKTTNTTVGIKEYNSSTVVNRDCVFYLDPIWSGPTGPGYTAGFYPQDIEISGLSIEGNGPNPIDYGMYVEQGSNVVMNDCDIWGVRYAFFGRDVFVSRFTGLKMFAKFYAGNGTSLVLTNCSAGPNPFGTYGYDLIGIDYCALISCTGDNGSGPVFNIQNCNGISFVGCGAESIDYTSLNTGYAFNFLGGNDAVISGFKCYTGNDNGTPIMSVGNLDSVTVIGSYFYDGRNGRPAIDDVYMDNSSVVHYINCRFTTISNRTDPRITFGPNQVTPSRCITEGAGAYILRTAAFPSGYNMTVQHESGLFTPVLEGTSTAGTGTYSVQNGQFNRVGNVVHFSISLDWSAHTGTGNMRIAGLPYAAATVSGNITPVDALSNSITMTAGSFMQASIVSGQSIVTLYESTTGTSSLTGIPMDTSGSIYVSGIYLI